jgi:hypothetical protein
MPCWLILYFIRWRMTSLRQRAMSSRDVSQQSPLSTLCPVANGPRANVEYFGDMPGCFTGYPHRFDSIPVNRDTFPPILVNISSHGRILTNNTSMSKKSNSPEVARRFKVALRPIGGTPLKRTPQQEVQRIKARTLAIEQTRGRKVALGYIKSHRKWLDDHYGNMLPDSGTLLDSWKNEQPRMAEFIRQINERTSRGAQE